MGIFDDLGVDTKANEMQEAQKVSTGGPLAPGVYKMAVDKAYVSKSSGGANRLNVEFVYKKEDGEDGKWFYGNYISSGDEKGNKTTYVDKNTGKDVILPGVIEANHLFMSLGVADPVSKKATIEMFGEQVEVLALPELSGKQCNVGIRNMFDDFKEKDIAFADTFLDKDGKNKEGEDLLATLVEKIEKSPIKKPKKAKAPKPEAGSAGAPGDQSVATQGGW